MLLLRASACTMEALTADSPFSGRLPPGDEAEPWVWDAEVPPARPPAANASASRGKATYSLDSAAGVESTAFGPLLEPVADIEWTMPAGEHAAGEAMPYLAQEASAAQRSGGWVAGEAQHHDAAGAWQAFETNQADDDIGFSLDAFAPLQGAGNALLSGSSALGGTLGYESDGSTHSEASEVWSAGSEEDTSEPPSPAAMTHLSEPPSKPIEPSEPPPARAKPAARKAPSNPLEKPLEEPCPCPFCPVECAKEEGADGRKTRKRRRKAVSRTKQRHGRWWQTLGYTGPVSASSPSSPGVLVGLKQRFAQSYCQRCSEVFRDHIIREKPNSAGCSRARACDECAKVLTHFTGDLPDHKGLWDRIDAKGYAKVRRSKPKPKPTRGFV